MGAWARYLEGVDEQGRPYDVTDRRWQQLAPLAARQHTEPDALLGLGEVFGDLAGEPRFDAAYREALAALNRDGARAVVGALTRVG